MHVKIDKLVSIHLDGCNFRVLYSHSNHKENIYTIYTKGNEMRIKIWHYKNQLNTKDSCEENKGQKKL